MSKFENCPVVFLHLPKTAGQTIHHAVGAICGAPRIAPYRLQAQVKSGPTFPHGYALHSGHLSWTELETVEPTPFSFSVIRDPRERFASFYFYMRKKSRDQAAAGRPPRHAVLAALLEPAERFLLTDDEQLAEKIRAGWADMTLTYFALRRLERHPNELDVSAETLLKPAMTNARKLSAIYDFNNLAPLEEDIAQRWGKAPQITGRVTNAGPIDRALPRWEKLCSELGSDRLEKRVQDIYVAGDLLFTEQLHAAGHGKGGRLMAAF